MFILIPFQIALSLAVSPEWLEGPVLIAVCKHSPTIDSDEVRTSQLAWS